MEHQSPHSGDGPTFVKCLSCAKLVKLPADPDPNATVRCPRCEETYPIGSLLASEIPELEIVQDDPSPDSDSSSGEFSSEVDIDRESRFVVAPALAKGAKRKSRRRRSSSSSSESESRTPSADRPAGATPSSSSSSNGRSSDSRRSSSGNRSRGRRKSKSSRESGGGFEFAKVILGALLAPPVAQLVIWWGLTLDPLNLGPAVSKIVPAIVPAEFHAIAEEKKDSDSDTVSDLDNSNGWDEPQEKDPRNINDKLPEPPSNIEGRMREKN